MSDYAKLISSPTFKKYKIELENMIITLNLKRATIMAIILVLMNIVLIAVDLLVYNPRWSETPEYLYLFFSHIIIATFLLLWLISKKYVFKKSTFTYKKILNRTILYMIISWCSFMGINDINISGQIVAYVICMFCISTCYFIKPLEAALTYSISVLIVALGIVLSSIDLKALNSNIVNLFITLILIYITSFINYAHVLNDFLNKKAILESKEKVELLNKKLIKYENSRTSFFANISHELRTPLNVIYTAEQMLCFDIKHNDFNYAKINKYTNMIKQNTYRLLRLINNLIDITKIDAANFSVKLINADIVKIVEDITMSVVEFVELNSLNLIFDTEVEEKILACDPDAIERIILNLLSNTVKFTNKNDYIYVNIFLEQDSVCISVKDTGIGISEEMQNVIFDRFVQVDTSFQRATEGSGIGLSIVKSLIEMHNGTVSVKSKLGEGSEFIIKLPDIKIAECEETINFCKREEKLTNRVNIEFSDIYN
jgi:signal transduction histidine kinase